MADPNEQVELTTEQARAGATPGMTRYILSASLVLVIIVFLAIYFIG